MKEFLEELFYEQFKIEREISNINDSISNFHQFRTKDQPDAELKIMEMQLLWSTKHWQCIEKLTELFFKVYPK